MRTISMIFTVLMGISLCLATTAGNVIRGLTANYTTEELQWDVPVSSGRNDTVTGTIQDVVRHLQAVAPERLAALNISTAEPIDVSSLFNVPAIKTAKPSKVLCNIFDDEANGITIAQGMYYLRGIVGSPKNGPGPGACGQVSCSYNSAIWWCNDNPFTLVLNSYGMIADGVQEQFNPCLSHAGWDFSGQTFYDDGWNVMVRGGSC